MHEDTPPEDGLDRYTAQLLDGLFAAAAPTVPAASLSLSSNGNCSVFLLLFTYDKQIWNSL